MRFLPLFLLLGLVACGNDAGVRPAEQPAPTPYELTVPAGFPEPTIPPDNLLTLEGIALGKRLFADPILSVDSTIACASCHLPAHAFSDPQPFSQGVGGVTSRNSMPLFNVLWNSSFFWDGRAASLEDQALEPVQRPVEMGEDWDRVVAKLERHAEYPALFARAFGDAPINRRLVVQAIAQFERTLISADSKYDRWLAKRYLPRKRNGASSSFTPRRATASTATAHHFSPTTSSTTTDWTSTLQTLGWPRLPGNASTAANSRRPPCAT